MILEKSYEELSQHRISVKKDILTGKAINKLLQLLIDIKNLYKFDQMIYTLLKGNGYAKVYTINKFTVVFIFYSFAMRMDESGQNLVMDMFMFHM